MGSKPNKLHIILKIFGFLVFSIGILYICQFFSKSLKEGFAIPAECKDIQDSGRKLLLCSTMEHANIVFGDIATNLPGSNDNVCVPSEEHLSSFTCYTKPTRPVYNDVYGIYRPYDPVLDKDTMPQDLSPGIDNLCASYAANTIKIIKNLSSSTSVLSNINLTASDLNRYKTDIGILITNNCTPTYKPGFEKACPNLITAFDNLNTIKNSSGLIEASNMVVNAIDVLSNMSTQVYSVYNGTKCDKMPAYALSNLMHR